MGSGKTNNEKERKKIKVNKKKMMGYDNVCNDYEK